MAMCMHAIIKEHEECVLLAAARVDAEGERQDS